MLKNYSKNQDGVIYQIEKEIFNYDDNYVETSYNSLGILTTHMAYLRLGNLVSSLGRIPDSILDVGYGNGSFLKEALKAIPDCSGYDISKYPIPNGCKAVDNMFDRHYDVVTFFDSLEHFKCIEFVKDLDCRAVCVSVPNCHYIDDEWFKNWKHRKPNEHLWHFSLIPLINFMERMNFKLMNSNNVEDVIRKNPNQKQTNILTCVFKKII